MDNASEKFTAGEKALWLLGLFVMAVFLLLALHTWW